MKKAFLLVAAILTQALLHGAQRPNIILFLVDDMGVMDTSVPFLADKDGKPEVHPLNKLFRTPGMERLSRLGIRMRYFYANSVCSPTRVSIMTGQSSARHRTTQWIRPEGNNAGAQGPKDWQWKGITPKHKTLPALLRKAGYRTIHAGKAHFGPNNSYGELPENFGFDVNIAGRAIGQPGSYYGKTNFTRGKNKSRDVPGLEKYHGKDIYLTEALTLEMNAEIKRSVDEKKPFFAYMAHYAVHAPFNPDPRFAANYANQKIARNAKAFATMIEGIDKSLGDMLDHVEKLGVAEDTLVFFLGDNGTDAPLGKTHAIACAAPLRGKKGTHYEGGMRVPFIAAWAKPNKDNSLQKSLSIPGGVLSASKGSICDLFPTILNLAGIEHSGKIDGSDLGKALTGGKRSEEFTFLMHFPHSHRSSYFTAWHQGDWKLVYHYHRPAETRHELFNLAADRTESKNLAAADKKELHRMLKSMTAALQDADAQYPYSKKNPGTKVKPALP